MASAKVCFAGLSAIRRGGVPHSARLGTPAMGELSSTERDTVERGAAEPMLDQVLAWAAVNSGSRNLAGLETMAGLLTDAYSALPGILRLEHGAPVDTVDSAGRIVKVQHGRHLHLTVRPTAP